MKGGQGFNETGQDFVPGSKKQARSLEDHWDHEPYEPVCSKLLPQTDAMAMFDGRHVWFLNSFGRALNRTVLEPPEICGWQFKC